jgi:uncharacterized protein (DUF3820 family)
MNTLPFGKHYGARPTELETSYLLWFSSQAFVRTNHPELLSQIVDEIKLRANSGRLRKDLLTMAKESAQ